MSSALLERKERLLLQASERTIACPSELTNNSRPFLGDIRMSNRSIFFCHGYAITPIIEACHRRGLFKLLNPYEFRERSWLCQNLQANAGPFTVALEELGRLGWIERRHDAYCLTKEASLLQECGLTSLYAIDPHHLLTQPSHAGILKEKIEQVFLRKSVV